MRPWIVLVAVVVFSTGCTHTALERRTVNQASTLTDLQYQQVLDNVAMFSCNPEALAWHLKLKGGLVQVADQGSAGLSAVFGIGGTGDFMNTLSPSAAAQRGILGQWDVDPTVEADDLELLRLTYLKAVNPGYPDLKDMINNKICELALRFDILPSEETIKAIVSLKQKEWLKLVGEIKETSAKLPNPFDAMDKEQKKEFDEYKKVQVIIAKLNEKAIADDSLPSEADLTTLTEYVKLHKDPDLKNLARLLIAMSDFPPEGVKKPKTFSMVDTTPRSTPSSEGAHRTGAVLNLLQHLCGESYQPLHADKLANNRNAGLVDQAADKIKKLQDLIAKPEFSTPWLCSGCKKDVPKCACYVGHYCNCGHECYVWVMPEQMRFLREFTLAVLTLAPNDKQDISSLTNPGRGAAFSPSLR